MYLKVSIVVWVLFRINPLLILTTVIDYTKSTPIFNLVHSYAQVFSLPGGNSNTGCISESGEA